MASVKSIVLTPRMIAEAKQIYEDWKNCDDGPCHDDGYEGDLTLLITKLFPTFTNAFTSD